VVSNLVVEPDTARMLDALWNTGFDPRTTALVAEPVAGIPSGTAGTGTFTIDAMAADTFAATVRTTGPALFLASTNWHPYWEVEVDGARAATVRANYALLAVAVPSAGDHKVVFRYRSPRVATGLLVAKLTWGIVLLLSIGFAAQAYRRRSVVA
jgi:hypothetical protein